MDKLTFEDLGIHPKVLRAIEEMGFVHPTEIQERAIPALLETELDFIGQAQTGTGKTAAFAIPLLSKIDLKSSNVQALILTPTRELANQVEAEIQKLAKYISVKTTCVYGGTSYEKQLRALKKDKPHIVVGTPGRVMDLMNKGALKLKNADTLILDEADEMLNMGFFDDVQTILEVFPGQRQLVMFSATMPRPILNLIDKSFNEYELVKVKKKTLSNENIDQKYFLVKGKYFSESLSRLVDAHPEMYGIIFCKTKVETKQVGETLRNRGHRVEILNGDMKQGERDWAMRNFKEKKATLMVCTDVAARGIDVNNLTHVINYGLPQDNESYVHRIGRTGRAGLQGEAYTIISPSGMNGIRRLEKHTKQKIERAKLPSVIELKQKAVEKELESAKGIYEAITDKGDDFDVDPTFEVFAGQFEGLSKEQLMKLMFTWKFNKTLRNYANLGDIEVNGSEKSSGGGNRRSGGSRSGGPSRNRRRDGGRRRDGRSSEGRSEKRRDFRGEKKSGERKRKSSSRRRPSRPQP